MRFSTRLTKSTAWYTLGNLFVRSINFILLPLYSKLIDPGQFGKFALLISAYTITSAIYQMGIPSGLSKFYIEARDSSQKRKIFSTTINIVLFNSILITGIIILFSKDISELLLSQAHYSELIVILFLSLGIDTVATQILQLLKTKEQANRVVLFTVTSSILNLALVIAISICL